jgi:glutathione S-transferase|nr:glutathione S-transferase family protein [Kofleriaceae bacterium]
MTTRLITIPFSHYCEKARWALERCGVDVREDGHLPLLHWAAAKRAGGGRTVPVMVVERGAKPLTDSTDIVAWADAQRPGALLPEDAAQRAEALAIEDELDLQLGPATRRVAYSFLLPPSKAVRDTMREHVPRWESAALTAVGPVLTAMLKRGLNVTPAGVARSVTKIDAVLARMSERLADGRRYFVGDRFTVADLTLASLAAPVLAVANHPRQGRLDFGDAGNAMRAGWEATRAGQHALRMYERERLITGH